MAKILLVIFAIIVAVIVATGWILGAIRRMLGIKSTKKSAFNFQTNFRGRGGFSGFGRQTRQPEEDILYKSEDVVVIKGKDAAAPDAAPKKAPDKIKRIDEGEIRDVDFRDKEDSSN